MYVLPFDRGTGVLFFSQIENLLIDKTEMITKQMLLKFYINNLVS